MSFLVALTTIACGYLLQIPQQEFSCYSKYHQHGFSGCSNYLQHGFICGSKAGTLGFLKISQTTFCLPLSIHEHTHQIKTFYERKKSCQCTFNKKKPKTPFWCVPKAVNRQTLYFFYYLKTSPHPPQIHSLQVKQSLDGA